MFRGLTSINVDDKGRITVPSQYRRTLISSETGQLVVTIDTEDRCLLLYPAAQWQLIEEKLEQLPSFDPATRRIQRLLMGHATEVEMDRAGRILLPTLLREYAGLEKSIMLVGQGKKFEIWGESQWLMGRDAWLAEGMNDAAGIPAALKELSL